MNALKFVPCKHSVTVDTGAGKDVLCDFAKDDLLQITCTFEGYYTAENGRDVVKFDVGSIAGAITFKNYAANTFDVNGDTYVIKGSILAK